ncbi:cytochrome C [Brevundimonas sp. NPDC092305]|uniref:cytochrome C n=1 Tax=Brevundimonas sp. NPDC092305 TaxID=3363957 RepID=UPI003824405A
MNKVILAGALLVAVILVAGCRPALSEQEGPTAAHVVAASDLEAGRYLVVVGGCNDCHTAGYARSGGARPAEAEWLKGSSEPHSGPWGTSFGKNLRLTVAERSEDEWVQLLDTGTSLPPMPWPSVRQMSEADKRAVYRYIRSLPGDAGQPAPAPLPPRPEGLPAAKTP